MNDKKDPRVGYLLTFLDGGETPPLEELKQQLAEEGVDVPKLNSKIQSILGEFERKKKRQWRELAKKELEAAKQKAAKVSAAGWGRSECLEFLRSAERGGSTEVSAFFRKHSGKDPSDDDLRSVVEAILAAQAIGEKDGSEE